MIRPELEPYNQTPIAIINMATAAGESAFVDEDAREQAWKFTSRLAKKFTIGAEASHGIALAFSSLAALHPRSVYLRMPRSMSLVERMKALSKMPAELAEAFDAEEARRATVTSREVFKMATRARTNPFLADALDRQLQSSGKKIQYARFAVPGDARSLAVLMHQTFQQSGVKAVLETSEQGFDYIHVLTFDDRPKNAFSEMSKRLASCDMPFALGAHATMLSPTAWAIIRALSYYGFGTTGIETGNAASSKRSGTRSLRKLKTFWAEAVETLFFYKHNGAPHGYDDHAAVPFAPSASVLAEIETYTDAVWPSRYNSEQERGIANIIRSCLELRRRRTTADARKASRGTVFEI